MAGRLENASLLAGRLLLAACFIPSGLAKLSNIPGVALNLAGAGLPYANGLATGLIVANVFGPLALLVGFAPRLTAGALLVVTAATAAFLHRFWELAAAARGPEQAAFLLHAGIAAGLLFYAVSGPGAWSWQGYWRRGGESAPPAPARATPPRKREAAPKDGAPRARAPKLPRAA